jgi:hypothetical protein
MEMTYKYGKRDYQGKMVDTVNVYLEGGVLTETALDELKAQHPGYTEVLMSSLVLFKPPEDIETELAEKNELISALGQTLRVVADALPDEQAANFPNLYGELVGDEQPVPAGQRRTFNGELYAAKVTLWDRPDQWPDQQPDLWRKITKTGEIENWVQPSGAHDAYPIGAKVTHNGATWESMVANNSWEPGAPGIGDTIWREVPPAGL